MASQRIELLEHIRSTSPAPAAPSGMPSSTVEKMSRTDESSPRSAETPRSAGLFRRLISLGSGSASRDADPPTSPAKPENVLVKKASALVPPNYYPAFTRRLFPLHEHDPSDWASGVVSFSDNAIRTELRDMYAIFSFMEQRPLMLGSDDVQLFVDWFHGFFDVLAELFELEERALYSWIEGVDTLPQQQRTWETSRGRVVKPLSDVRRTRMKAEVMRLGGGISRCAGLFAGAPVAQNLPKLAAAVEAFVDCLTDYLRLKKDLLPMCIRSVLSRGDVGRFYREYWRLATTLQHSGLTVPAVTGWMPRKAGTKWRKRRMSGRVRKMYTESLGLFEEEHTHIVKMFEDLVSKSEEERVKLAEEHGAALARAQEEINKPASEYTASEAASGSCASFLRRSGCDVGQESLSMTV